MHQPCQAHMIAAKRGLRYLVGTPSLDILYKKTGKDPFHLIAFSDSDWLVIKSTSVPHPTMSFAWVLIRSLGQPRNKPLSPRAQLKLSIGL